MKRRRARVCRLAVTEPIKLRRASNRERTAAALPRETRYSRIVWRTAAGARSTRTVISSPAIAVAALKENRGSETGFADAAVVVTETTEMAINARTRRRFIGRESVAQPTPVGLVLYEIKLRRGTYLTTGARGRALTGPRTHETLKRSNDASTTVAFPPKHDGDHCVAGPRFLLPCSRRTSRTTLALVELSGVQAYDCNGHVATVLTANRPLLSRGIPTRS